MAEGLNEDEFLVTRHSQFNPPINILNIYGDIESRSNIKETEERWNRILEIVLKIETCQESIILIGDMNRAIGNGEFGVEGNTDRVSFGGKLIHKFLSGGKYQLVNNSTKCEGGPFTRVDPSNTSKKSCLGLVIVNNDLFDFVDKLKIDKERLFTPHRAIGKRQELIFTDHYSLYLTFKDLHVRSMIPRVSESQIMRNTNTPGGWGKYKELTENNRDLEELLEDDEITSTTEFNEALEKTMEKVKYKAFGKVSFSNARKSFKPLEKLYIEREEIIKAKADDDKVKEVEERIAEILIQKQRIEYEKKLKDLNTLKNTKGISAAVFNLKSKVLGEKKTKQEAVVIDNPVTGLPMFKAEEIKEASINYLKNLLENREPKEEYNSDIKVLNIIHERRMQEDHLDDDEFNHDDFSELLKILQKKNKSKYKFILKSGVDYQKCLFKLFSMVWDTEQKPRQWEFTIAHQLFKGSGLKSALANYRFIHTKDENPKAFEHIVISKAKPKIVKGCSKFQIGAIPKHQSQEHLFTLKSVMAWYELLKIAIIVLLYDISKFFDRVMLKDGLNALYNSGVKGKLYRLVYELNRSI